MIQVSPEDEDMDGEEISRRILPQIRKWCLNEVRSVLTPFEAIALNKPTALGIQRRALYPLRFPCIPGETSRHQRGLIRPYFDN